MDTLRFPRAHAQRSTRPAPPARERVAFEDSPDQFVAQPEDVARECLASLANGPVLVPVHLAEEQPGFTAASWAPLAELVAVDEFTRVGRSASS